MYLKKVFAAVIFMTVAVVMAEDLAATEKAEETPSTGKDLEASAGTLGGHYGHGGHGHGYGGKTN